MKKNLLVIALLSSSLFVFSCSQKDLSSPAVAASATSADKTAQVAAAVTRTTPAPGNYKVKLYINDADTSTSLFAGYVFTFTAKGALTAKVGTKTYKGKWESKDNGTELKLDIDGTPALHEIDKSWDVTKMTNTLIDLFEREHDGAANDVLTFVKL